MKIYAATEIDRVLDEFFINEQTIANLTEIIMTPMQNGKIVCNEAEVQALVKSGFGKKKFKYTEEQRIILGIICLALEQSIETIKKKIPITYMREILVRAMVLAEGFVQENAFAKNILLEPGVYGQFEVVESSYRAYEVFPYDQPDVIGITVFPKLGVFRETCTFPTIRYASNHQPWISLSPNEITSMDKMISETTGSNILVLGCGIGYYAFFLSENPSVRNITIVEPDKAKFRFFSDQILPQFPNKNKIHLLNLDPFAYLDTLEDGTFKSCFVSLWENNLECDSYIKAKLACKKFGKMKCLFWNEKMLLRTLSGFIVQILQVFRNGGDAIYKKAFNRCEEPTKFTLKYLMKKLDGIDFRSGAQLETYLNPINLNILLF